MNSLLQFIEPARRDDEMLSEVHAHSLDLLENCGIRFHSEKARQIWHGAGAKIAGDIVKIPGHLVESALKKAPGSFR
jgi:trimethylamine:corrinoid methyltransferase-like protein